VVALGAAEAAAACQQVAPVHQGVPCSAAVQALFGQRPGQLESESGDFVCAFSYLQKEEMG
jgi:hypothetical protein